MGWDKDTWRKNVSVMLFDMGSIEFQKFSWNINNENIQGSFVELITNIEDYVIPEGLPEFLRLGFVSEDEKENLESLSDKIDVFYDELGKDLNKPHEEIWVHPTWISISRFAASIFLASFKEDFIREERYQNWFKRWHLSK
ncbi:MAG: hypothetical protein AB8G05_22535 [Oligoflexales bacterium]